MASLSPPPVRSPQILAALWPRGTACPFDEIVDVRSPAEFADDRIPGAVNLPVLDDTERVEVGTLYRRAGAFEAAKVGAALVSANIARHLGAHFAGRGKDFRPLLYCWRGGQRSASLAHVLAQIGWRTTVLHGGYKTYREHVRRELDSVPAPFEYRIVSGATGSGKTRLLHAMAARGAQVLDLEGLANHRGSVLGRRGPQPSQKGFDSRLLAAFDGFAPETPIWLEAESSRIGDIYLPAALWAKMRAAVGIELRMPREARVSHLLGEYAHLTEDPAELTRKLQSLTPRYGHRQFEAWCRSVEAGDWGALAESLLAIHYDPAYAASTERYFPNVTVAESVGDAGGETMDRLAINLIGRGR